MHSCCILFYENKLSAVINCICMCIYVATCLSQLLQSYKDVFKLNVQSHILIVLEIIYCPFNGLVFNVFKGSLVLLLINMYVVNFVTETHVSGLHLRFCDTENKGSPANIILESDLFLVKTL